MFSAKEIVLCENCSSVDDSSPNSGCCYLPEKFLDRRGFQTNLVQPATAKLEVYADRQTFQAKTLLDTCFIFIASHKCIPKTWKITKIEDILQ